MDKYGLNIHRHCKTKLLMQVHPCLRHIWFIKKKLLVQSEGFRTNYDNLPLWECPPSLLKVIMIFLFSSFVNKIILVGSRQVLLCKCFNFTFLFSEECPNFNFTRSKYSSKFDMLSSFSALLATSHKYCNPTEMPQLSHEPPEHWLVSPESLKENSSVGKLCFRDQDCQIKKI